MRTIANIGQEIIAIVRGYGAADLKFLKRRPLIRSRTQIVSGTGIILPLLSEVRGGRARWCTNFGKRALASAFCLIK